MADLGLAGDIITAALTAAATAGAAFWGTRGVREAARSTDTRADKESQWRRLEWAAALAASSDPRQAEMAVVYFERWKTKFNPDEEQRDFIRTALDAMVAAPIEEYSQGATDLVVGQGATPPPELQSPGETS